MDNVRFDTIVIGGGPAGVSAAITLKIRNKSVLLISLSNASEKVVKAEKINNYPGLSGISGLRLAENYNKQLEELGVERIYAHIIAVYGMGDYFSVQTTGGDMYEAKTVIIGTGIDFGKPYPGENEYLGRGVSYCATCDAPLYKGKAVVIVGETPKEEEEAAFMSEICSSVTYIPLYKDRTTFESETEPEAKTESETETEPKTKTESETKTEPEAKTEPESETEPETKTELENDTGIEEKTRNVRISNPGRIQVVRDIPVEIKGGIRAEKLILKNNEIEADGIFILRNNVPPSALVPGIELENGHIKVNRGMETNIPGCFAAGDITGTPYQYVKAAGEGNVAAISAVQYLATHK